MLKDILFGGDLVALNQTLQTDPSLVDRAIEQDPAGNHRVHPIHLLCDVVFEQRLTEAKALEMTRSLLAHGADVNGRAEGGASVDSLLITAASLYCEDIAISLIDRGADLHWRGTHQATALHWASWTGSARVVARLIREPVELDDQGDEFYSTPLLWAVNGWLHPAARNRRAQPEVMRLLLAAGADPDLRNADSRRAVEIISEKAPDLLPVFRD